MSSWKPIPIIAAAALALATALPPAQVAAETVAVDRTTLDQLQQLIEQQQQQLKSQASQLQQQSQTLESLQQQVSELSRKSETAVATVTTTPTVAAVTRAPPVSALPSAAHEVNRDITSGQDRVKLSVSGHINRAGLFTDDGREKDYFFVDNASSHSRVRFIGIGQVSDDLALEAALEMQVVSNSSDAVNQINEQNGSTIDDRRAEVLAKSKKWGTLWLGRGWTASDSTTEMDLSGTDVVVYTEIADMAGGMIFRGKNSKQLLPGVTVGTMFNSMDGLSRNDRVRYDTPAFAGFSFATSATTEQNQWDAALRYTADLGAFKVASALSYFKHGDDIERDSNGDPTQPAFADAALKDAAGGSISVLHESGFNLSLAGVSANHERDGRNDQKYWWAKLGYIAHFFNIGTTNFSVGYWDGKDFGENGSKSKVYSVAAVQNLEKYGTELYLGVNSYQTDFKFIDTYNITAAMLGARIKF